MPPPDDGNCPVCRKAPVIDEFFGECRSCLAFDLRRADVRSGPDRRRNGRSLLSKQPPWGPGDERDDPDAC